MFRRGKIVAGTKGFSNSARGVCRVVRWTQNQLALRRRPACQMAAISLDPFGLVAGDILRFARIIRQVKQLRAAAFQFINELPTAIAHFFFNDTATTEVYTLSLHDALPI